MRSWSLCVAILAAAAIGACKEDPPTSAAVCDLAPLGSVQRGVVLDGGGFTNTLVDFDAGDMTVTGVNQSSYLQLSSQASNVRLANGDTVKAAGLIVMIEKGVPGTYSLHEFHGTNTNGSGIEVGIGDSSYVSTDGTVVVSSADSPIGPNSSFTLTFCGTLKTAGGTVVAMKAGRFVHVP